jgi:uncharacterized protein YdcH (DUF465 family)
MNVEHHDLAGEFPEQRERIHMLKMGNAHFVKLSDEYHVLSKDIERLENKGIPVADETLKCKRKNVHYLKINFMPC